jgi:hypothetical protein
MDHSYYKDRVSAWIDQELPPYEQEALTQHIAECEECRALADRLRQVYKLVDDHNDIGGSDEYWEELARKTEARIGINQAENVTDLSIARTTRPSGLVWKIAAVAASLVALTFIGLHRQEIFQDIFNQETVPTATQRPAPALPKADTSAIGGQTKEQISEPSAVTEDREVQLKKEAQTEAAGAVEEAEPEAAPQAAPEVKRSAPPPTTAADEGVTKVAVPAPVKEKPTTVPTPVRPPVEEPKTSPEQYIDKLKDHLSEAVKPQTQSFAAPNAQQPVDSAASESDQVDQLAHWRRLRDSLLAIYPIAETKGVRKGRRTRVGGTSAASRPDSLIAACLFNVARFTKDSAEYDQSIRQLTALKKSSSDPAVGRYLDSALKLKQK